MLENIFHLKENHTDAKTEIMAGITTFMTMAYILAVNPNILSASGMDSEAVLIATALASFVGTALMALLANYPFALAPGMGLNAYFSYTVVLTMGYSWQLALMAVFVEGIIFIVLSLTNVREAIFNAIPLNLKRGVSVGIGLFIAFIGLQNAGLSVDSSTLVTITSFTENFHTSGICALLALATMLRKCRMPHSRNILVLPFVPAMLAIIYGVLYIARVPLLRALAGDVTVVFCLLFAVQKIGDFPDMGETIDVYTFDYSSFVCIFQRHDNAFETLAPGIDSDRKYPFYRHQTSVE